MLTIGWLLLAPLTFVGGDAPLEVELFSTKDGLIHNAVSALYQDPDGLLWVGTQAGICTFNGREFDFLSYDIFPHDEILALVPLADGNGFWVISRQHIALSRGGSFQLLEGLGSSLWDSHYQDPAGYMWVSGKNRLVRASPEGSFEEISLEGLSQPILINAMCLRKDGILMAGVSGQGLFLYDTVGRNWAQYDTRDLLHVNIHRFVPDSEDRIWIASHGGVAYMEDGLLKPAPFDAMLPAPVIRSLTLDDHDGIWMTGFNSGALYWDGSSLTQISQDHGLPSMILKEVSIDQEGRHWFLSSRGATIDLGSEFWTLSKSNGLPTNYINTLIHPCEGLSWLGTNQGLVRVRRSQFQTVFQDSGQGLSISGSIYEDDLGQLWFPTQEGLGRARDGQFRMFGTDDGLPSPIIRAAAPHEQGKLWVGTGDGVAYFDGQRFHRVPGELGGVTRLTLDRDGHLWAVGNEARLWVLLDAATNPLNEFRMERFRSVSSVRVRKEGGVWIDTPKELILFEGRPKRHLSLDILSFQVMGRYYLRDIDEWWIATVGGLYRTLKFGLERIETPFAEDEKPIRIRRSGQWIWVVTTHGPAIRLREQAVVNPNLWRYADGVWEKMDLGYHSVRQATYALGTHYLLSQQGLVSIKDDSWSDMTVDKGLVGNQPNVVYTLDGETLWIGTNGGITKKRGDMISSLTQRDGLANDFVSALRFDNAGYLWIRTDRSIQRYEEAKRPPKVVLDAIFHDEVELEAKEPLEMTYQQNNLSFELDALYPQSSESMLYTWSLEGNTRIFEGITQEERLHLPGLPPDIYTLRVRAYNKDMLGSDEMSVRFNIRPPFWLEPRNMVLGVILIALFTYLIYRFRLARKLEQARLLNELTVAHDIQMALMPAKSMNVPGYDIAGICEPALEVGGDYYDFLWLDSEQDRLGLAVVDVSGKSMQGAMISVLTSGLVYGHVGMNNGPGRILSSINYPLYEKTDRKTFVTGILAGLDLKDRTMCFANAGHSDPLLIRDGQVVPMAARAKRDLPLGAVKRWNYQEICLPLEPGDIVFLYTDGVSEAQNVNDELYGEDRLADLLIAGKDLAAADLLSSLLEDIAQFRGKADQNDDITAILLKVGCGKV